MNNTFKTILLNIARLPGRDQQWILNQLTTVQQQQFSQWQGNNLLAKARRFRKLPLPPMPQIADSPQLPDLCKELEQQEPFYIAIILDQGQFSWEQLFIATHEQGDRIKKLLSEKIPLLKPATKASTFNQWQNNLSFKDQLEHIHG